jgi:hypothetical protein
LELTVWSTHRLLSRFGAGGWWWQQPTCSLNVMWHGEVFHGLGDQGVQISTLFGVSPLPSVAATSQQGPGFTELMLSASAPQSPSWILPPFLFKDHFIPDCLLATDLVTCVFLSILLSLLV